MKKQHKIMFGAASKSIRDAMCKPDRDRAVMDYLVPKPKGYTGI